MGMVLAAVLGMATAGAADYDNVNITIDASVWDGEDEVNITAVDGATAVTVNNVSAATAINTDINITASNQSATLKFDDGAGLPAFPAIAVGQDINLIGTTTQTAALELGSRYTLDVTRNVTVRLNSSLTVSGTLTASSITFSGGTGAIGGTMTASGLNINAGSTVTVTGTVRDKGLPANTLAVNGGALGVSGTGTVDYSRITTTSGTITVASGGTVDAGSLNAQGASNITITTGATNTITIGSLQTGGTSHVTFNSGGAGVVDIDSLLAGGNSNVVINAATAAGNAIDAHDNATVQFSAGQTHTLSQLTVQGNAIVNNHADVNTALVFSGGTINLNANTLTVTGPGTTASGRLNVNGGTANFSGGDVTFSGGGITVGAGATNAALTINGGLTIGSGADLDTSQRSINIGITGAFELDGTLHVGYDNNTNTARMATITGATGLSVGNTATITMTPDMIRQAISSINGNGEEQVLGINTITPIASGTMLYWDNRSVIYEYTVKNGGIWVTGVQVASRDEIRNGMLQEWSRWEQVGENAGTLLPRDFTDAVIDADRIFSGMNPGVFDSLSVSGKFNAEALSALIDPAASGAGYDALMLYNGSGLAMANQAMVSANAQILRYIARRTEDIRREIRGNDLVDPDSYDPEPLPPSRVWAEALYHTDKASPGDGFAGYYYSGSGIMVGYDQLFGDLAVGASASYLGGNYEDRSALAHGSKLDTYGVDLYATLTAPSGWFGSMALGYGYTDNRLRDYRVLNGAGGVGGVGGWNSADYGSHTLKVSASVGRDFWIGDYLTLSPSLGFDYVGSRSAEHRQFFAGDGGGGGAETLEAGVVKNHSSRVPIGLSASYNILGDDDSLLTLTGSVGYAYELNDGGASGVIGYAGLGGYVAPVGIVRRDAGRHAFTAGVRGKYYYRRYEFGFGYDYLGKRRNHQHSLWLNGGMSF